MFESKIWNGLTGRYNCLNVLALSPENGISVKNTPASLWWLTPCFVSSPKDRGCIYLESVINCNFRDAWHRLYTSKLLVITVHVLNEIVFPFFDQHNAQQLQLCFRITGTNSEDVLINILRSCSCNLKG